MHRGRAEFGLQLVGVNASNAVGARVSTVQANNRGGHRTALIESVVDAHTGATQPQEAKAADA